MSKRKFYRTVITFEVLSEDLVPEGMSLDDIDFEITYGHMSGQFLSTKTTEVSGKRMAKLLLAQGSDPEFFQLDAEGNNLEDLNV